MPTLLRPSSAPLLQLGALVFDAEVSVGRGGRAQFSERRVAAGVTLSDHSFVEARVYQVEGGVSAIAQPQNLGRPGADTAEAALATLRALGQGVASALVPLDFLDRREDFEARLQATLEARQELELVSKVVGRVKVVLTEWSATTTAEDGQAAVYRLTLREVDRAGLSIAQATPEALALVGSGGSVSPGGGGPSQLTPATLDVVP